MNVTQAFKDTRQQVTNAALDLLWADLCQQAYQNNEDYDNGLKVKRTVYNIINSRGYAVNVVLTAKNNITVRGLIANHYRQLQTMLESITD